MPTDEIPTLDIEAVRVHLYWAGYGDLEDVRDLYDFEAIRAGRQVLAAYEQALAEIERLQAEARQMRANLYPESVILHNAAVHHALRREVNRVAAHAATEDRTLTWVADELIHAMATNPYPDGSPADEIERLRAELAATYVQAIDFDDTLIWQDRDHRELGYTEPDYAGDVPETWVPLYRRVTEPAGSVAP